jgi:hypothetical protein
MTFPRLLAATVGIGLATWANVSAQAPAGRRELLRVVGAFVQSEPGPLEGRANPITPENPIPRRSLYFEPRYPSRPHGSMPAAPCRCGSRSTIWDVLRRCEPPACP